jgi:hypothetical protein
MQGSSEAANRSNLPVAAGRSATDANHSRQTSVRLSVLQQRRNLGLFFIDSLSSSVIIQRTLSREARKSTNKPGPSRLQWKQSNMLSLSGSGDFPDSEQDARDHIRAIRLSRGVDDVMGNLKGNSTTEDLQELLNV